MRVLFVLFAFVLGRYATSRPLFDENNGDSILLSQVKQLQFYNTALTNARRVDPIPQMTCYDANGLCYAAPASIKCKNIGFGESGGIEWDCSGLNWDSDEFTLKNVAVSCEGYTNSEDPYVLKDSCGVSFYVDRTDRIKLSSISTLRFYKHEFAKRVGETNPVSQLNCNGYCKVIPSSVICANVGFDAGMNVMWQCEDRSGSVYINEPNIVCVEHPSKNGYVIKDSCALYYTSVPDNKQNLLLVSSLYFNEGQMTQSKTTTPVLSLNCRNCNTYNYYPASVRCERDGVSLYNYADIKWKCYDNALFSRYTVMNPNVNCERYDSASNYVLKDSCGLTYSIEPKVYTYTYTSYASDTDILVFFVFLALMIIVICSIDFYYYPPTVHSPRYYTPAGWYYSYYGYPSTNIHYHGYSVHNGYSGSSFPSYSDGYYRSNNHASNVGGTTYRGSGSTGNSYTSSTYTGSSDTTSRTSNVGRSSVIPSSSNSSGVSGSRAQTKNR